MELEIWDGTREGELNVAATLVGFRASNSLSCNIRGRNKSKSSLVQVSEPLWPKAFLDSGDIRHYAIVCKKSRQWTSVGRVIILHHGIAHLLSHLV